jgi:Dolichyl-phosphate-mannose-protein mannosyltransferase
MLPFHGDLLARLGQLPFYLLGGIVLYALARRIGAPAEHAVFAPAFFLLSRPIVEQAVGADVDLICAVMFLTSLYLGIIAVETNERRDWALWGISLGLFWGSKYLALVYTPVFLALAAMRGPRPRTLWAVPGILGLALPWYLRNWAIAGSPIYPSSLTIAGLTIARGAFTRSAMENSMTHTTDLRAFPVIAAHALGTPLLLVWIPFGLLGAWRMVAGFRHWTACFVALAPVLMVPLFWFGVPDNVDSRFLMPAVVTAMVPFAFAFSGNPTWNRIMHALYGLAMLWLIVGVDAHFFRDPPWPMSGWLSLQGLVDRQFLGLFLIFTLAAAGTWHLARRGRRLVPAMAAVVGAGCVIVAIGSERWCTPPRCSVLQTSSPFIRASFIMGWRWVGAQIHGATIAYTGNNLPYPLFGERLTNQVLYVNIDDHPDWRFHDYDRADRAGHRFPTPTSPPLATSSGVYRRARPEDGPHNASRPRYPRMYGDRLAWLQNLKRQHVDHLFVSVLSPYEIADVWHNVAGFPIEDEWAKAEPRVFTVVYENPQLRVYAVDVSNVAPRP